MFRNNDPTAALLPQLTAVVRASLEGGGIADSQSFKLTGTVVAAIQSEFGGRQHYIPKSSHRVRKTERAAQAAELRRKGLSVARISHQLGCTPGYVYCLLSIERKRAGEVTKVATALPRSTTTPTRKRT